MDPLRLITPFASEALKDDLPEEEEETGDVELPCGDDY